MQQDLQQFSICKQSKLSLLAIQERSNLNLHKKIPQQYLAINITDVKKYRASIVML